MLPVAVTFHTGCLSQLRQVRPHSVTQDRHAPMVHTVHRYMGTGGETKCECPKLFSPTFDKQSDINNN